LHVSLLFRSANPAMICLIRAMGPRETQRI
jgi:hypothetical protein